MEEELFTFGRRRLTQSIPLFLGSVPTLRTGAVLEGRWTARYCNRRDRESTKFSAVYGISVLVVLAISCLVVTRMSVTAVKITVESFILSVLYLQFPNTGC